MKKMYPNAFMTVIAIVFLMMCASTAHADVKRLGIRSSAGSDDAGKLLKIEFPSLKQSYKTGGQIRFKIKGSETFYLYLFGIGACF
ncbi:hypothetical protein [uncultured Desulfobacter sp.]|uniref:hypothetical protein n=1 Tax=uncultured Desulfobacter sp. TaxID=240139 RepID=UPI002AA9334A|nr:hypothetical protein [uncultured Desulfobacter sp.]